MGSDAARAGRAEAPGELKVGTHWTVFLPSLVIALLYGGLWSWFSAGDAADGLARVALLVVAVGVPMLLAHAAIRFFGAEIVTADEALIARPGVPKRTEARVRVEDVVTVSIRRGLIGRVFDVGTVIVTDRSGQSVAVPDMAAPWRVAEYVEEFGAGVSRAGPCASANRRY